MLDIASFHSRLCDFTANVILDYNEMVRPAANTRSHVEKVKEKSSMEQGELFAEFAPKPIEKPVKVVPTPKQENETTSIAPKVDISRYPRRKQLTYQDYLKIHCGNKAAALYWYERNEGRQLR